MSLGGLSSLGFAGLPPPDLAKEAESAPEVVDTALPLSPVRDSSRSG